MFIYQLVYKNYAYDNNEMSNNHEEPKIVTPIQMFPCNFVAVIVLFSHIAIKFVRATHSFRYKYKHQCVENCFIAFDAMSSVKQKYFTYLMVKLQIKP